MDNSSFDDICEKLSSLSISSGSVVSRAVTAATANMKRRSSTQFAGRHYSVSLFYSMATEQDVEIQDDLVKGKKKNCTFLYFTD